MTDFPHHRPNVGVVLFHPDGRVWYGRRAGTPEPHCWQFPQGGVDEGEDYEAAARRELAEETGVVSAEPLAEIQQWIAYDFPADYGGTKQARGWQGQKQKWFAFRFTGEESEIDLEQHAEIEFDAWRWGRLDEAPDLIVPFKRKAYEQVVAAFAPLVV
ncbi:RNA pyrophosphohydrolase [Brevundimonas viscosa]|uniref:RNA pyrophosphohydrolase n=1 Tax=Brevundimonas viscosa TaxID=871741 RepID=A0A1I6P8X6_9CAUL|nr:RNA pyrophosphohydrolase [Brevundimonas viscosa]SFS36595.1 putative (di)nucleoside polyphosphate hydrolase [Brevundimonas viscosa]